MAQARRHVFEKASQDLTRWVGLDFGGLVEDVGEFSGILAEPTQCCGPRLQAERPSHFTPNHGAVELVRDRPE
jgi:hypothetical protein